MSQLGKAFIEVKADLKKFPAELRTQLKKALTKGLEGVEFTQLETAAKESGETAAKEAAKAFEKQGKPAFEKVGKESGRSLLAGLKSVFSGSDGKGFLSSIGGFFGNIKAHALYAASHGGAGGLGGGAGAGAGGGSAAHVTVNVLGNGLQGVVAKLEAILGQLSGGIGDALGSLWSGLQGVFTNLQGRLGTMFSALRDHGREMWERFRELGVDLFNRLGDEDSRLFFRNLRDRAQHFWLTFRTWAGPFFRNLHDRGRLWFNSWRTSARGFWLEMATRWRAFTHGLDDDHWLRRWTTRGRSMFRSLSSSASSFFGRISSGLSSAFTSAAEAGRTAVASVLSQLSSLAGTIGSIGGGLGGIGTIAMWALLAPVVVMLAGALIQMGAALFALPAAAGVAVAAILPVIIAFKGVGAAVTAGLSGDTEAFNQALKGLAPSARTVVKELVALNPQFKQIKANVQSAFFKPLAGFFTEFGRTLLPVANRGLTLVASSMGHLARQVGNVFTAPANMRTFNALFASTNRIVQTMEPGLANLAQALLNLIAPALPFLERGATLLRDFGATAEGFTRRIGKDGTLVSWLARAGKGLRSTVGLVKELGTYLVTILSGKMGDAGMGFIEDLRLKVKELVGYLKTKEGQEFINNLTTGFKAIGKIVVWMLGAIPIMMTMVNQTVQLIRDIGGVLEAIGAGAVIAGLAVWGFIKAVGEFFAKIGKTIGKFFTETIPKWWGAVTDFFSALPGRIWTALKALPGILGNAAKDAALAMLHSFFVNIGILIGLFLSIPGLIATALKALPGLVADIWRATWKWTTDTVSAGWDAVWGFFSAIPGKLVEWGTSVLNWATGLWTSFWDSTNSQIETGWNKAMDFFHSIPGRIAALGPAILKAAKGIGHSIADGLASIGDFATDLGKRVTGALKTGINWAISAINEGIAKVDDALPGTLPRIPKLARGAVVDSPMVALIGEAGPEVVVPLNNRRRAQQLAEQSGLLSMLRGAGGQTIVNVVAYLDPTGALIPVVKTVVDDSLDQQGSEFTYARAA